MRFTKPFNIAKRIGYLIPLFSIVCFTPPKILDNDPDFRNFYGISWRGSAHDNLAYAKQMGYDYVFYQNGMEKDPLSSGLRFYFETPEYLIYNRGINTKKTYSNNEITFYNNYCATIDTTSRFPENLAKGWKFNDTIFSAQLNFQSQKVISWSIDRILRKADSIQAINPHFVFGGYAWDVPQPSGDFFSNSPKPRQVTLKFWTGEDHVVTKKSNVLKFKTYSDGCLAFYKELFRRTRNKYPDAKFLMEPYRLYEDWMAYLVGRSDAKEIMPDMLCQEGSTNQYVNDKRIIQSGIIDKNHLSITTPNVFKDSLNREIAAVAALNGSWFNWYGRFGGSGDMPNYQSIREVPARLQLIRMLSNWENLNKTPLESRKWNGTTYSSSNAFASPNLIALKKPNSNKLFVVFLTENGVLELPKDNSLTKVFQTDNMFIENKEVIRDIIRNGQLVSLVNKDNIGKGYIFQFQNKFNIK